jgi:S1-C subfamily serine protease
MSAFDSLEEGLRSVRHSLVEGVGRKRMKRLLLPVFLVSVASGVSAQERRPAPTQVPMRERTAIITTGPDADQFYFFKTRRGIMGITVSMRPAVTDSIGAVVEAVTPAGPAYKAGLRSGDIITSLNGKSLVAVARETRRLSPGLVLIEGSARLGAGDTATVEYRRGRDRRTVAMVLEPVPEMMPATGFGPFELSDQAPPPEVWRGDVASGTMTLTGEPAGATYLLRTRSAIDLELAPMNPGLGQYFGINDGVLVISVPEGSQLNLRAGDVIRAIDGRSISYPNQFFRILRTYDDGDTVKFDIVRAKRRATVAGLLSQ